MCGITGKIYFTDQKKVTRGEVHGMNERIKHRGPDDEGIYVNPKGNAGLGHRRLSIIDLSPLGHQPMSNEDGTIWIVFNGEIYNFQSLRPDLEKRGHRFRSKTDTETIVHLYEEYGEECLKYLRGMFAFAIWDEKNQKLFLARDRVGKKPLKYYIAKDFIVFASELKAFLDDPGVPREMDFEAIHHYLTFQYVPHPMTGFKGIRKLPPAHYLTINLSFPVPRISEPTRYWKLDYSKKLNLSEEEWQGRILEKLEECVKMRLMSDVPLGAFLSGGLDSSAIVAMMAKHSPRAVKTFSIGFEEQAYNELPYARIIAEQFATDHQEFIVKPNAIEILPKLIWHYEEPYADSSALPTYYLSELTRKHVTVALNGDGGDENFAGYPWYPVHQLTHWYYHLPLSLRRLNKKALFSAFRNVPALFFQRAAAFLDSTPLLPEYQYYYYWAIFYPYEKTTLYNEAMRRKIGIADSQEILAPFYKSAGNDNFLDRALFTDINSYLPGALLPKVDIASMAVSLEARSPFLDHEFMELCAQIPAGLKLHRFHGKYILKQALKNIIPNEILKKKKQGFQAPLDRWFKKDLREMAYQNILGSDLVNNYFNKEQVGRVLHEHQSTAMNHSRKIWALLWLALWHQSFFS